MHTPSTSTWLLLSFAALAAAQNSTSSPTSTDTSFSFFLPGVDTTREPGASPSNPAAESSISSIAAKLETAYTTDPGWGSFQVAQLSWYKEFSTTNTLTGPAFTNDLSSFVATQSSSAAIESWVAAKTEAALEALLTGVIRFVATQTYLNDDVRTSVVSDYQVLASLADPDGPDPLPTTITTAAPGATSTGAAAALELSGLMAGAIAGAMAIVGTM